VNIFLDPVRALLMLLLFLLGILAFLNFSLAIARIWLEPMRVRRS
jgi:hypothetical protein